MSGPAAVSPRSTPGRPTTQQLQELIESGEIIGQTLVLTTSTGTVNIPLTGVEAAIDFANLSLIQKNALKDCLKGNLLCDAFGNPLGNLI